MCIHIYIYMIHITTTQEFFCQLPPVLRLPAGPLDYGAVIKTVQEVEAAMGRLELDQSPAAGAPIAGRVWKLSQDPQGCHAVQQALEDAGSDDVRMALTQELHGHVWEAMKCRNANHVLQRCVTTTRSAALQFIIDEIMKEGAAAVRRAARHQFGCRILQRLLEHCPQSQVECLVELLLEDAVGTAKHTFGNYVMQHVMEHGTPSQRHRLSAQLTEKALPLATDVKGPPPPPRDDSDPLSFVCLTYCNGPALCVRRGSFTIWTRNPKTLRPKTPPKKNKASSAKP